MKLVKKKLTTLLTLGLLTVGSAFAADKLPQNARLAIVGDSITQQLQYSMEMEAYLLMCAGRKDISVIQFGWGGEHASGFDRRLEWNFGIYKPNVVTLCYGMNDGRYRPYDETIGNTFDKSMRSVVDKLKTMNVENVVISTPGAVDTHYFKRSSIKSTDGRTPAQVYNENLNELGKINKKIAEDTGSHFANLHSLMTSVMAKAKKEYGEEYAVCGRDGVHPGTNGHLVMAYSFLKALGYEGNLAEITVDMNGAPTASQGHVVISGAKGAIELESSRYPFIVDRNGLNSAGSILPYLPFYEDLNRFTLKVANLSTAKAKVTWGKESLEFSKRTT